MIESKRTYFSLLDCARGIAALCVLFFHYQGFYYPVGAADVPANFDPSTEPLFAWFGPLYLYGLAAVQFFWIISGFVFATVYMDTNVSGAEFARARIARLYPLHLLTLFVVGSLQLVALYADGGFLVYQHNDLRHFLLHLAFASGWGLQSGESFNSPIWSVSVEVLIYVVFWVSLRAFAGLRLALPVLLFVLFVLLYERLPYGKIIWYCGACFYVGVLLRAAFDLTANATNLRIGLALFLSMAGPVLFGLKPAMDGKTLALASLPGVVLLIVALEDTVPLRMKSLALWIGDCSYGIYLWHIPVMLTILLMLDCFIGSRAVVSSPWLLLSFLLISIAVARISFVYFERPTRELVRRRIRTTAPGALSPNRP